MNAPGLHSGVRRRVIAGQPAARNVQRSAGPEHSVGEHGSAITMRVNEDDLGQGPPSVSG
jgi:hypothetical protein